MTRPVPNLLAPIVTVKDRSGKVEIGKGTIVPPWNSWFQQFTQPAPAVIAVVLTPFTANSVGTVIITGATTVTLTRGISVFNVTGQMIIPISIGDELSWTGPATVSFLGS
jgi:hypothetical protein